MILLQAFICLILWHTLPLLFGSAIADVINILRKILVLIRKVVAFVFKAQWFCIKSAYTDFILGAKWWGQTAKKGYKKSNDKSKSKAKKRSIATYDKQFLVSESELDDIAKMIQTSREYFAQFEKKDQESKIYEKPAYLRRMLFETDEHGAIIFDEEGRAKRFSVKSLFQPSEPEKNAQSSEASMKEKTSPVKAKKPAKQSSDQPLDRASFVGDLMLDGDGFEPDIDPALYVH